MKDLKIRETADYDSLVPLFIRNKLEFGEDDPVPTDLVKCWEMRDLEGNLEGGAVLAKREGEYILDGIAVNESLRQTGLGRKLLSKVIEEVKNRGGNTLFLVAKAPGFFRKEGFKTIDRENAPMFFECFGCPQYGVECNPEVMKITI